MSQMPWMGFGQLPQPGTLATEGSAEVHDGVRWDYSAGTLNNAL